MTAVQTEYSLWARGVEDEVLPTCRALGIGFVPYSPLGGAGSDGGRFQADTAFEAGDFRAMLPRFQSEAATVNRRIADLVGAVAAEVGCSAAQLSLAWLLAQGEDIVPIPPGTKQIKYLRDNVAATGVVIDPAIMERLTVDLAALPVVGARYTDEGMKGLDA